MNSLSYTDYSVYQDLYPQAKTSLGYNTNNKYPSFPPIMNDGRAIVASYQPEAVANDELIKKNNIGSNWEYRQFLTKNALAIINQNFTETSNDMGYYKRFADAPIANNTYDTTNTVPYLYKSYSDNNKPKGYVTSDLKTEYLSREQLNSRLSSTVITQDEFIRQ
uniref:Uncharacterized protein n=1 Tax=viral metagenome TaxID=1070528 RepID=A0A6C0DQE4_9ZZZZ